jgi:iron complex outermembrane receptor protein
VVTARKRAERLSDVPIAETALRGADLAEGEHLRIDDLNLYAPSTNIVIPSPHQTSLSIRGLGANPANDGLESSAGVFIDGVYLGRPGMAAFDLIDLDTIEVLRGPQGTLFGKNTTAGALLITTQAPSATPEAIGQVSVGDYAYQQYQANVSGPLGDSGLLGRIAIYDTQRDGWVKDTFDGSHLNGENRRGVRVQLAGEPEPDLKVRLIGEYDYEDDSNGATLLNNLGASPAALEKKLAVIGAAVDVDPSGLTTADNDPTIIRSHQAAFTSLIDWKTGPYTLSSVTGYRDYAYYSFSDVDGTNQSVIDAGYNVSSDQFSQELRIATPKGGRIEAVAGLYYFQQDVSVDQFTEYGADAAAFLTGIPNALLPVYARLSPQVGAVYAYNSTKWDILANPKTRSYAGFGQAIWRVTDRFNLTLGARETDETKSEHVSRPNPVYTATGLADPSLAYNIYGSTKVRRADAAPSLLFSADYHIRPSLMVYASASQGEKAGGVNASLPASGFPASSLEVKPEIATDFEGGLKGAFFEKRVVLNLAAFYTKVRDYQATFVETPVGSTSSVQLLTNVGKVRSQGVEAEATVAPMKGLSIQGAASWVDAIYASYPNGPCPAEITTASVCNLTGRPVAGAPKWVLSLRTEYVHALPARLEGFVGGDGSWRSRYYGYIDDSAYARAGGYALFDFHIGVRSPGDRVEIRLWTKNAFDRRYVTGDLNYGSLLPGVYIPFFGEPRTFGATLRARY